jgi:hypothetical protein
MPTSAGEGDYPVSVLVYGTAEDDYITGKCRKTSEMKIQCDLLQVHVSRKGKLEDRDKITSMLKSKEGLKELNDFKVSPVFKKMCSEGRKVLDSLASGQIPKSANKERWEKNFKNSHPRHKSYILETVNSLIIFCNNPSAENYESYLAFALEKDMRTCTVWHNSYKQTFTRSNRSSKQWISNEGPSGECDVIDISVLKKDERTSGINFWVYESERIITNKEAKFLGGLASCKDRPEEKMFYDWKQPEKFFGCDYIDFD